MLWTKLTIICIMASVGGAEGGINDSGNAVLPMDASQDERFTSQFFTENRFNGFQERVGNCDNRDNGFHERVGNCENEDGGWRTQLRKRRRKETGSVDIETFSVMTTDEKLLALFSKLSAVENKQSSFNMIMAPTHEKVEILEDCVNIQARKLKMLSYRSLDLEARSRRNNMIFRGLADGNNENCTELIVNFLKDEMQVDVSAEQIVRAHRLGSLARSRAKYMVTRRPLIVAFRDYAVIELIMGSAKCLKGTFFRIERDYPTEIADARQRLWPKCKAERVKYPRSRVSIVYPAKLVRNGKTIVDEFPD